MHTPSGVLPPAHTLYSFYLEGSDYLVGTLRSALNEYLFAVLWFFENCHGQLSHALYLNFCMLCHCIDARFCFCTSYFHIS